MPASKLRLLFLCTGNSCRSQMAEGWANFIGPDVIDATSAGIEAHGQNPRAIRIMAEAGVDISHQASRRVTPEMLARADIIVTVCGHADEHCPVLPPGIKKLHWPFDDPAKAKGSEEEIMAAFRRTRDLIRRQIETFVIEYRATRQVRA